MERERERERERCSKRSRLAAKEVFANSTGLLGEEFMVLCCGYIICVAEF